ncbi:MAG: hypothetical protein FJX76_17115 [Armatimonadetes bacterium]|nr:hypothetical protein [Armatimonadota bacterium]
MRSGNGFKSRSFSSSRRRLGLVAALPAVAALAMFQQAAHYYHTIPAGDASFRMLVFAPCVFLAMGLAIAAWYIFSSHFGSTIQVDNARLVIRDANAMVSSDWSDVSISTARVRLGVRQMVVCVAGRPRVVDELFYPNFDEICQALGERLKTFDRAVRRTMVADDWVRAS